MDAISALLTTEIFERTMVVRGELDFGTRALFESAASELTARCPSSAGPEAGPDVGPDAVLDTAGLSFIDASGLGALVGLSNTLTASGARLRTIHPSTQLRRLSALFGLDTALGLAPGDLRDRQSAAASLPARAGAACDQHGEGTPCQGASSDAETES